MPREAAAVRASKAGKQGSDRRSGDRRRWRLGSGRGADGRRRRHERGRGLNGRLEGRRKGSGGCEDRMGAGRWGGRADGEGVTPARRGA